MTSKANEAAAHTPGPWMPYEGQRGWEAIFPVPTPGNGTTALALVKLGDAASEANIRLIAAAPDLLAALQAAVAQQDYYRTHSDYYPDEPQWEFAARAAIARATTLPQPMIGDEA